MESGQFFGSKKLQKYPCKNCGQPIKPGQYFAWNRTGGTFSAGWHWDCSQADVRPPEDKIYRRGRTNPTSPDEIVLPDSAVVPETREVATDEVNFADGVKRESVTLPARKDSASNDPMKVLAEAIEPHLHLNTADILAKVDAQIKDSAREIAKELASVQTVRVEVAKPSGAIEVVEGVHENFPQLLTLIKQGLWPYLHGPSGSFKSTSARKAAEVLGLDFEMVALSVQTFESRLYGFIDANGQYHATGFRRCYENGGLFLIDEFDNMSGNLGTTLNPALANGHCSFPDKMVARHKDFVCVATGNTAGRGASRNYAERRAVDGATLNRFASLEWGYDWKLTKVATLAINEKAGAWCEWVKRVNDFCVKEFPQVLATPRACFDGARLLAEPIFTVAQIAEMLIFRGLDRDSTARILSANPLPEISAK